MTKRTELDGLPILDAKRAISLTITKEDVAKSADSIKDPSRCAIARACMRELHVKEARIHLSSIYIRTNNHNWVRYQTPTRLRSELIAFDRGGTFEPCTATLRPRPPSNAKTHSNNRSAGKKHKRNLTITNVRNGPA